MYPETQAESMANLHQTLYHTQISCLIRLTVCDFLRLVVGVLAKLFQIKIIGLYKPK